MKKFFNLRRSKFWLLTFAAMFAVNSSAWAETLMETFDAVTVSSRFLLSNGWVMLHSNGTYQGFGSSYDYQIKSGNYDGGTGNSLYCSYSDANEYVVIPTKLTGTFTYYAKRAESSNGTITFFEATKDGDDFTVTSNQLATTSTSSSWGSQKSFDLGKDGKYVAIQLLKSRIDQISAEIYQNVSGPGLAVTGDEAGVLAFGIVNPSSSKELTLSNPGTEDITVDVTVSGDFTADLGEGEVIAKNNGTKTLTISAPSTPGTYEGSVTITPNPAVTGINAVTINLTATVKDSSKMFEDFAGKALPEDWATAGSYTWSFSDGYAKYTGGSSYSGSLTTAPMVFSDAEVLTFDAAGSSQYEPSYGSSYAGNVTVQASEDGVTFSDVKSFSNLHYNTWQSCSATIPAGTKFVRFKVYYASIDNIYGGKYDTTPRPKLAVEGIANGGSLSWGYTEVPAGSEKTITLLNNGTANLAVTIETTNNYTVTPASGTVEAGSTLDVVVATPANDGPGVLTIKSVLDDYEINLTSYYKVPTPAMSVDKTSIAFGQLNEVKSEVVTISNTGDAELVVTVENSNTTNFSVSSNSITVAPGETGELTITYNYSEGTWGKFNADVKLTPNYGSTYDVKTITVSATSKNPDIWSEDFEDSKIPAYWTTTGWTVSMPSSYLGGNGTYMAGAGSSKTATLTTPRLFATEGQELSFYVYAESETYFVKVEYSNDEQVTWNEVATYTTAGTQTFTAPAEGNYYLRFTGYYTYIDDFEGFKLDIPEHIVSITASNIPTSGLKVGVPFEATVTVAESRGVEEEVTAALYVVDSDEDYPIGKAIETVAANGTKTLTIEATPSQAGDPAKMYIVVTYAGGDLKTETVERTVDMPSLLQLSEESTDEIVTGTDYDLITLYRSYVVGWNTIVLPLDVDLSVFPVGAKAYAFTGYSDGELKFSQVTGTTLYKATPYLLYLADNQIDIIQWTNTQISSQFVGEDNIKETHDGVTFQGTYAPIADMSGNYGVTPEGKIAKGGAGSKIKGFRAYFTGIPASEGARLAIYDQATGISRVLSADVLGEGVYNLQGQRVQKAGKGLYIVGGKKVVRK